MPDFSLMLDELTYSLIVMVAGIHWSLQKSVLMAGYTVKLINQWLIESAFAPLIAQTSDSLRVAVGYVFVIALLVLGLTYLLAALVRWDVVSPRSALLWYAAGALFFTVGPSFYQSVNGFRLAIGQAMYLSVLDGMDEHAGDFSSLAQIGSSDLGLGTLCDQFDVYLPGASGPGAIDGLDIALAYLRGHAQDVMGYPQPVFSPCGAYLQNPNPATWAGAAGTSVVPMAWNLTGAYFDHSRSPVTWEDLSEDERAAAVGWAGASQQRALTAWPLLLFALLEQVVHLLITTAMGITFVAFGVAILFAFFKRTESIAQQVINQWIELIIQTVIIALIQALVIGFFLAGAATGSAPAVVGIGLLCLVFVLITVWSGAKAVWNSFNRLFQAMSQAAGGVIAAPGSAVLAAGRAGASAAGTAASAGSSALAGMAALHRGATLAQAAGTVLGGSPALSSAARTLAHLPGTRHTALGRAAEQFTEGSMARRAAGSLPAVGRWVGPLVGAALLSSRDPSQAVVDPQSQVVSRPMLVPAVGDSLESWTRPRRARQQAADTDSGAAPHGDQGEAARPLRMGTFIPMEASDSAEVRRQRERSDHAAEMVGEEMEQHLSEALRAHAKPPSAERSADRLEQAAEALLRAGQQQAMLGQLRVTGIPNVASVMGDVVREAQQERRQRGQPPDAGMDYLQVGERMARAIGVTPQAEDGAAVQRDLARFGLFVDQALRLGLTPQQTERVVREVQASPEGRLRPTTRDLLDKQTQAHRGVSWLSARGEVDQLERMARMLPPEITAFGTVRVPVEVKPQGVVPVQTPTSAGQANAYDSALRREAALGGSTAGGAS
jgi:hypothetical protein